MSSPTGPASGLPVRMPRPRQPGRHRRPEPVAAPEGAPALVLAVPGVPSAATRGIAEEVVSIARSELPLDRITTVASHPQALAQCAEFLRAEVPWATAMAWSSTAEAVLETAARPEPWAAIGTPRAAELYRCVVLREARASAHLVGVVAVRDVDRVVDAEPEHEPERQQCEEIERHAEPAENTQRRERGGHRRQQHAQRIAPSETQREYQAGDRVDADEDPVDRDAGQSCGLGVVAQEPRQPGITRVEPDERCRSG